MTELFLYADVFLFRLFNGTLTNPVFDVVMPVITEGKYWLPSYALLLVWLVWKGGRGGRVCAVLLLLGVIIGDQFNSLYLKEWIGRVRPCRALDAVRLVGVGCGAGKSFPSSHAVNNFCAAVILTRFFPKTRALAFGIAAVVAFSRVYVGVHYPADVLAGAGEGALLAFGLLALHRAVTGKFPVFSDENSPPTNKNRQ